jgi:DNA-binding CsgD family transcriptional regulator
MGMADPPRGGPADLVELVEGTSAVLQHLSRMQLSAQQEVYIVDCPPYLTGSPAENPEELQALRRGVRYRALYHAPNLAVPGRMAEVLSWVAAGEEARTLPDVHLKMIIVDHRIAMIPLSFDEAETGVRILIHPSPLLSVLITCFDQLWERAAPLAAAPAADQSGDQPGNHDRELLAMLAAGMKDRAMARALGVTERTVTRRITQLMGRLGAETRFQAALQAAKRGWL